MLQQLRIVLVSPLSPDDAVVFPSELSYNGLVLTAKTSLHYGGVCV